MRGSPLGDYRCTCIQLGLCSIAILDTDGLDVGLSPELGFEPGGLLDVMQVWVPVKHVKERSKRQVYFLYVNSSCFKK